MEQPSLSKGEFSEPFKMAYPIAYNAVNLSMFSIQLLKHGFQPFVIPRATCGSASLGFGSVFLSMSRHLIQILQLLYLIAIGFANLSRADLHAPLGNRCSDIFAFPHFLRKLIKPAKYILGMLQTDKSSLIFVICHIRVCYHDHARGFHGALRKHSLLQQKF